MFSFKVVRKDCQVAIRLAYLTFANYYCLHLVSFGKSQQVPYYQCQIVY